MLSRASNLTRLAVCSALLAIAAMLPSTIRAQTSFDALCPDAKGMFRRGASDRILNPHKYGWRNDFPMLIYDASGISRELEVQKASATAEDNKLEYERSEREIAVLQEAVKTLNPGKTLEARTNDIKKQIGNDIGIKDQDLEGRYVTWQQNLARANAYKQTANSSRHERLYWLEPHGKDGVPAAPVPLTNPTFPTPVYTTEKVLVLVCQSSYGDGISVDSKAVEVNGPDSSSKIEGLAADPSNTLDRIFVLDASKTKNNSLETVLITRTEGAKTETLATAVLARHKVIHYSAGGGLLIINAPSTAYTLTTLPTVITTLTTQGSTTTTGGVVTASSSQTNSAVTAGTVSYLLAQRQSTQGFNSVAGVTWYPFGHDTFPVTKKGLTLTYSWFKPYQSFGLFLGTSTNTFGNFTAAPAFELFPGMQVFAGVTLRTKTVLSPGVTACGGYGTSPSFAQAQPSSTTSSSSSTSAGVNTTTSSSTTTAVTLTSGCSNGDRATAFAAGATGNITTSTVPALSYGILFNTNLLSRFTVFGK